MRLQGERAERFCEAPEAVPAILLHGPDPAFTAEMRRRLVARLDPEGSGLTRLDAAEARRAPAVLYDALRARGFFAERPVVLVTQATDGMAQGVAAAIAGLSAEDGVLVLEAGMLRARTGLRKLFEGAKGAMALGLYPEPPGPEAVEAALVRAGLTAGLDADAARLMAEQARGMDQGSFARLVETVALMGLDAERPLTAAEVAGLLPAADAAETDGLVQAVMLGQADRAAVLLSRLTAGGTGEVGIAIAMGGFLRQLLQVATTGTEGLRPPVYGARRDAMAAILRRWDSAGLERALGDVHAIDRLLRSAGRRPDRAILERCLMRLAVSAPRR
ncbi:MAG: hypothetical protein AAFV86_04980 [Pseudomonadota bacterium]